MDTLKSNTKIYQHPLIFDISSLGDEVTGNPETYQAPLINYESTWKDVTSVFNFFSAAYQNNTPIEVQYSSNGTTFTAKLFINSTTVSQLLSAYSGVIELNNTLYVVKAVYHRVTQNYTCFITYPHLVSLNI